MQRISFSGNNDGSADYRTNSNGFLTTGTDKLFLGGSSKTSRPRLMRGVCKKLIFRFVYEDYIVIIVNLLINFVAEDNSDKVVSVVPSHRVISWILGCYIWLGLNTGLKWQSRTKLITQLFDRLLNVIRAHSFDIRDSGYGLSQWETSIHDEKIQMHLRYGLTGRQMSLYAAQLMPWQAYVYALHGTLSSSMALCM